MIVREGTGRLPRGDRLWLPRVLLPPPLLSNSESTMSHEQAVHDRINLHRLVRRLEKSVADEGWHDPGGLKDSDPFPHAVWIRTQGTLGVSVSV
jgi:hypothetical protein